MPDEIKNNENNQSTDNNEVQKFTLEEFRNEKWREALSEENGTDASLADIKTFDNVIKSYIHSQKMVGSEKIALPRKEWTDEDWTNFYNKIGRPSEANQYEFEPATDVPEGFTFDENYQKEFKETAHKNGLSKKQANAAWKFIESKAMNGYRTIMDGAKNKLSESHTALRKEWGTAYDQNMKIANKAAAQGGQDFMDWLQKSGAGREPMLIKAFTKLGNMLSEDKLGETGNTSTRLTPKEAKAKINKIMADKNGAYWNKLSPEHKDVIEEVETLYKMAYPDEEDQSKGVNVSFTGKR